MTEGLGTPGTTPDPIVTAGGSGATAPTAGVGTTSTGGSQSTKDTAKDEARGVAQEGVEGGKHVAAVGADQAKQVAGEAGHQVKALLGQAQSEAGGPRVQPADPRRRPARSPAPELGSMASKSDEEGLAKDLAQQASAAVRLRRPLAVGARAGRPTQRAEGLRPAQAGHVPRRRSRPRPARRPDDPRGQGGHARARARSRTGTYTQGGYTTPVRQDVGTPVSSVTSPGTAYGRPSRTGDAQPAPPVPAATSVTRSSASRSRPTCRPPGRRGELGLPACAGAHERPRARRVALLGRPAPRRDQR